MSRRFCLSAFISLIVGALPILASPPSTRPALAPAIDPVVQKALDAAVRYIVSKQNKDGSVCDGDNERTAITALAIMALHSRGVQVSDPTSPGTAMRKAMDWILEEDRLRPDGYFGTDGSMMYTHGITTLMLGQMINQGADLKTNTLIRDRLTKAVDLILEAQKNNQRNAWRYRPDSSDADVCITTWQIRALAAARQAGVKIPNEAFAGAADFIKSCADDMGGFGYLPGGNVRWSCSAAGLLALQICGQGHCTEAKMAIDYLQARPQPADRLYYLYACPAYVMAMGASSPADLQTAKDSLADTVMQFQQKDGSWVGWDYDNQHGQVYCTSLVILGMSAKAPVPVQ